MRTVRALSLPVSIIILSASILFAAGSSIDFTDETPRRDDVIQKVVCEWISDDILRNAAGPTHVRLNGRIGMIVTIPAPGLLAPDDNYDIVLTDENGLDILDGFSQDLTDRSSTLTEKIIPFLTTMGPDISLRPVVFDEVLVSISNAGSLAHGTIVIYVIKR